MNYYAVERSTGHLAHYGVKGMRWGVRKAIASGNQAALDRHYMKAAKKLAKLQNIGNNPYKSAAKAGAYGAAAAATGTLAIGGTGALARGIRYGAAGIRTAGKALEKAGFNTKNKFGTKLSARPLSKFENAAKGVEEWGKGKSKIELYKPQINEQGLIGKAKEPYFSKEFSNNTLFRTGAALATAGLAAKAYQHGRRAKRADEYREKAERWKNAMDEAFSGTNYEGHYERVRKRKRRYY